MHSPSLYKKPSWIPFLYFLLFVSFSACIKDDLQRLSGPIETHENLSLPFGSKDLKISTPSPVSSTSIPGTFGLYYYNGLPFASNSAYFRLTDIATVNLNGKNGKNYTIVSLNLKLLVDNYFPTKVYVQLYLINGTNADLLFLNGEEQIDAAVQDSGRVIKSTEKVFTIPFTGDRLEQIKNTSSLYYNCRVNAVGDDPEIPVFFSDENYLHINVAFQMEVKF